MQTSVAKLSSRDSLPLADNRIRGVVIATAQAIAERFGVQILKLQATDNSIEVELGASKLAAIGFAAELRRVTNRWAETKNLPHFWPDPPPEDPPGDFPFDGSYDGWLKPSD